MVIVPASWKLGSCSIEFTSAASPLQLPSRSDPAKTQSFLDFCQAQTPACDLNPLLFNGHLQTAWTAVKQDGPPIHYKRRVFQAEDKPFAGHFSVDIVVAPPTEKGDAAHDAGLLEDPTGVGHHHLPPRTTYFSDKQFDALAANDTKPLLITLHGLSGGSYEVYLRHVLAPLVASPQSGNHPVEGISGGEWEAIVVNSRGCAGSRLTSSVLYNARATWDVRQVVKWARQTWPNRPIYGIGYSLGANMLTNYVAEEGDKCLLSAAVVVSNPWNLEIGAKALQRTWIGMEVYNTAMGKSMRNLVELHKDEIGKNAAFDLEKIRAGRYLFDFDRDVQCPAWGYATESAYYRDASCADSVLDIRIPFFAIHAKDDPIAPDEAVPYAEIRQNPYVVICTTSGGGHLSWFQLGGDRWHAKPAVAFLNAINRDIDLSDIVRPEFERPGQQIAPFRIDNLRRKAHVPGRE